MALIGTNPLETNDMEIILELQKLVKASVPITIYRLAGNISAIEYTEKWSEGGSKIVKNKGAAPIYVADHKTIELTTQQIEKLNARIGELLKPN